MDAVVFDMDGVIVDSERHWAALESEQILPTAVGEGQTTPAEIAGMNVDDLYDYLDDQYGTRISHAEFRRLYDEAATELYTERVTLLAGFHELLDALRDREVAVAVASSSPHDWIEMVLDRFDLETAFDAVVSAEDVEGPSKPAPTIYEYAADAIGVAPEQCVAVEDAAHGVAAATAAGFVCVGYRTDASTAQDLSDAAAVATGPAELREQLLAMIDGE